VQVEASFKKPYCVSRSGIG